MYKHSFLCLLVLVFNSSVISANKKFIIKLKGNVLYRERAPKKSAIEPKTQLTQPTQETTNAPATKKNETVLTASNQAPADTASFSQKTNAAPQPDRQNYICLQSHCLDQDSLNPLDSVVIDVYSNGEHITAGISDKTGFITTDSIPPGNYNVVFYRNNYNPVSVFVSRTSSDNHLYMDIPFKRKDKYLYDSIGQRIWKHIFSLESIPILFVLFLIAFLYKKVTGLAF